MISIYDIAAEQSLLGSALAHPDTVVEHLHTVPHEAWHNPLHRRLAIVLREMDSRGEPIDLTTVKSVIAARGASGVLTDDFLESLFLGFHTSDNAPAYAARILDVHSQNGFVASLQETLDRCRENWEGGYGLDVAGLARELRHACDDAEKSARPAHFQLSSVVDLLEGQDTFDWLTPGLMERMDRVVLTGAEGGGKSVLLTQMVTTMVGGLHPFTAAVLGDGDQGLRVAVVDCELTPRQARGRYRRLVRNVDDARAANGLGPADWKNNLLIEFRPEGLDITGATDRQWLERFVTAAAPDVLVMGPIYRLSTRDESDPGAVREMQHVIDSLRVRHNCAFITEAHSGHATDTNGERKVRPAGSSLWLRWPEFGYGMRRAKAEGEVAAYLNTLGQRLSRVNSQRPVVVDVVPWRGSREERAWPDRLRYGTTLPWEPFDPTYYDDAEVINEF
ncbi:AAA family ATPase [Amycolatopsis sp. FDAARGOS 1241]|uniref:AAA family ATPase n=1 Tax=Amycolatopsis sp. FDAARGOS 1241 TaxID=2778070 RepID=UPI00195257AF|nr:AAA family ATPase [Amycolatopsis sp. FDAARGOS 1241]QRP47991.1 AAA family ATPase [Amycolatopsis sp. FDAARGOS 1241]